MFSGVIEVDHSLKMDESYRYLQLISRLVDTVFLGTPYFSFIALNILESVNFSRRI